MKETEKVYKGASRRLQTSVMVGGLWLGPARFAFSINSAILFRFRAREIEDKYVKLFVARSDIAGEFRRATNMLGSGTLLEFVGEATGTGTPSKAFNVGPVLLFNSGEKTQAGSRTALVDGAVATAWKGGSEITNFEDIRHFKAGEYTSMAFETNKIPFDALIKNKNEYETYIYGLGFLVPIIATLSYREIPNALYRLVPFFAISDLVMSVDPQAYAQDTCSESTVTNYKLAYGAATAVGEITAYYPAAGAANLYKVSLKGLVPKIAESTGYKAFGKAAQVVDFLNVPTAFQWYIGNDALKYVASCKDQNYKILAYQQLDAPKESLTGKLNPVGNLGKGLNIGEVFKGVGQTVDVASMLEVLNLRATLTDQYGFVEPKELYYVHLEGGNTQWHGAFTGRQQCFQQNFQAKDGTSASINRQGITVQDRQGNIQAQFRGGDWGNRALLSQLRQDLARHIVPNQLISTPLDCNPGQTAFEIDGRARLLALNTDCRGVECVRQRLSELTGKRIDQDLSAALGLVERVYTSEGIATIAEGFARFTRLKEKTTGGILGVGATQHKRGSEVQAPGPPEQDGTDTRIRTSSSILISGDASVKLKGQRSGTEVVEQDIGQLQTIITSRGRIEFDPATKQLHVALYVLSELQGGQVASVDVGTRLAPDGRTPTLWFDNFQALPGQEAAVRDLHNAVKKVQEQGGFQQFDTANKTYSFGLDANGNPVLRIIDKATGKVDEYKITGDVRRDPTTGELIVPTDKGEFRFKIDMQNGEPKLIVTDPNGFKDIATLLAARSPGGILVFDPSTGKWQLLNGQDIPLNQDFANKGLSLLGSPDGAKGLARDALLALPKRPGREAAGLSAFAALPSWPQEPALFLLMVLVILVSVGYLRWSVRIQRSNNSPKQEKNRRK